MKKSVSFVMAALMAASLATTGSMTVLADGDVTITVFNSKTEIESQLEEAAAQYSEEKGVNVEIYDSNDPVTAHMATRYASNDPYTLSMVDAKDIYSMGEEHAVDLSDQDWVKDTTQAISVNDKVYGFPLCVGARGIIYNADAIKNITGEDFDPSKYQTLDSFKELLLRQLVAGGMESPTGIMKEDWSLAAHFLAEVYEQQPDVEAFPSTASGRKSRPVKQRRIQFPDGLHLMCNDGE